MLLVDHDQTFSNDASRTKYRCVSLWFLVSSNLLASYVLTFGFCFITYLVHVWKFSIIDFKVKINSCKKLMWVASRCHNCFWRKRSWCKQAISPMSMSVPDLFFAYFPDIGSCRCLMKTLVMFFVPGLSRL